MRQLKDWFKKSERVVIAFSGGIDSALLVYLAGEVLGKNSIAIIGVSPSLPSRDKDFAQEFCKKYSIRHKFIETSEFENNDFLKNPENRCYFCKHELFSKLVFYAKENNYRYVIDGTNASDLSGHRPGYRAISEIDEVKTPYVELGITKDDIRNYAKELGIEIADKPASACLSSRVPWGQKLYPKDMKKIDRAENFLKDIGLTQVRVRHHEGFARIQTIPKEITILVENRDLIKKELRKIGYEYVTLDLSCYGEKT